MLTLLTSFNIEEHIFPALPRARSETATSQFFEQLAWAQARARMRSWMKQCPPAGRCVKHYLGNAEAGFTYSGQEHGLACGSRSQGCHLVSGLPRGASAIHAGIRKRILDLDPAPSRLAEARACSAESLAESILPASLLAGVWRCQKHHMLVSQHSTWEEAFWLFPASAGSAFPGKGGLGCGWGRSARVPRPRPPEHHGILGARGARLAESARCQAVGQ